MHNHEAVTRLAARQGGVIAARQLVKFGLNREAISFALGRGELIRSHRGVYRLAGSPSTEVVSFWCAIIWGGPGTFLSHRTAAWVWKLDGFDRKRPETIDLIVAANRVLTAPEGITLHRSRGFTPGKHTEIVRELPCTNLERTLVDLASIVDRAVLNKAVDSATRRHPEIRETVWKLTEKLSRCGREGISTLRELCEAPSLGPTSSGLEHDAREVLRSGGLEPVPGQQICDASGDQIGIFDLCFPEANVVVECQSKQWHSTWLARERDIDLKNRLERVGWHMIEVTAKRLREDAAGFLEQVRSAIERRRGSV